MPELKTRPLRELATITASNVDKKSVLGEQPVRLCNYMDVYSNEYITADLDFMEATATKAEIARFRVEPGDVMITKDSETPYDIGIPAVVVDGVPDLVCGYHLAHLKPRADLVDPIYLAKQLASSSVASYFSCVAAGSTRYGLSGKAVGDTPIPMMDLAEQKQVAKVLRTVDEAIEQTEALIAKMQQIKAGMMHDLFTRGVTEDGQLRPAPDSAPGLYKDSQIGRIPASWGIDTLNGLVDQGRPIVYGILMPGQGHPGGVPVVKVKDIKGGRIDAEGLLLTSPEIDAAYARSRLKPGDILLTIRGTVGRLAMVPDDLAAANITQDTARVGIKVGSPAFYFHYLGTASARRHLSVNTLGVAVQGINLRDVRTTPVPVPDPEEQERIASRMDAANSRLHSEHATAAMLREFKSGLMADLLSGRVTVNATEASP